MPLLPQKLPEEPRENNEYDKLANGEECSSYGSVGGDPEGNPERAEVRGLIGCEQRGLVCHKSRVDGWQKVTLIGYPN